MPKTMKIAAVAVMVVMSGAAAFSITHTQPVKQASNGACCGLPWCPPGSVCPVE